MLRVGVIGTGGMGGVHSNHYRRMPGVELIAFDSDAERLSAYCQRFEAIDATSIEELLDKCDVVDICLPTAFHHSVAMKAIAAGRPVLIEKPLCGSFRDCVALIDAAAKANVPLMPAQVVRFFPEFRRAHDFVKAGKVGRPAAVRTRRGGAAPKRDWFLNLEQSGGVLLDVAVHDFDWLRWTFGAVTHVSARSVGIGRPKSLSPLVGDYALSILKFDSGTVAQVEATWLDPAGFRTTYEVCGSDGMIEWDSRDVHALQGANSSGPIREAPLAPHDDPYFRQLDAFLTAVKDSVPPPVSAEDGAMAVAIAESAIESARFLRPVSPPSGI